MPAVPYLIAGGAQVAGSVINSKAQGDAADKSAEAIEKGIALQDKMYTQDRADAAPYRGLGAGAVGNLAYLGGITMPQEQAPSGPTPSPYQTPKLTLANIGANPSGNSPTTQVLQTSINGVNQANDQMNQGQLGPTTRVTKNGVTRTIPTSLLPKARSEGYQEVAG